MSYVGTRNERLVLDAEASCYRWRRARNKWRLIAWVCSTVCSQAYPLLKELLGSAGFFWLFSAASLLNLVWTYLLLPETNGLSLGDIEDYFRSGVWLWHRRPRRRPLSTAVDD